MIIWYRMDPAELLGNLRLQKITHDPWRLMLAFDSCRHDLVISAAHPE
jgi:hypothetical protein